MWGSATSSMQNALKFRVLEHIPKPQRGGDWDRESLRQETRLIFSLTATVPLGLNENIL